MDALEQLLVFLESEFLCLTQLDDDFVTSSYENNFSDFEDVSNLVSFEVRSAPNYPEKLKILYQRLIELNLNQPKEDIWDKIKERAFDPKKLCILLWFSLEDALKSINNREELEEAILALRVYLAYSCLNSAQAYDIFNPFLYQKVLSVLRHLYRALSFNVHDNIVKLGGSKKSKGKKKKDMEASETEVWTIPSDELGDYYDLLKDSLDSLFLLFDEVSLSSSEECVNATVSLVRDIARFDFSASTQVTPTSFKEFQDLRTISERSFSLAHRLCQPRHAGSRLVLPRFCLPRLLFMTYENQFLPSNSKIPNSMIMARDKTLQFLEILVEAHHDYDSMMALVKNIAYRCPDKADYRTNVSTTIALMLKMFPPNHRKDFLNFLYVFGSRSKPACRSFAIELAITILSDDELDGIFNATLQDKDQDPKEGINQIMQTTADGYFENVSKNETIADKNQSKMATKPKKKRPQPFTTMTPTECVLRLLIRGTQDKSANIRSRALQLLQTKLEDYELFDRFTDMAQKLDDEIISATKKIENEKNENENQAIANLLRNENRNPEPKTGHSLLNLILQSCDDFRARVRRWGLVALSLMYLHLHSPDHRKLCIEKIEVIDIEMSC